MASLLPEVTYDQTEELLRESSIPLPSNRDFMSNNGFGLVNAYKMLRLAEEVRAVSPLATQVDMRRALRKVDLSRESQSEFAKAMSLIGHQDCGQVVEGFKSLRRSFLLDHTGPARAVLAEAYRSLGYDINSRFFELVDPEMTSQELAERVLDESLGTSNMIFAAGLDKEFGLGEEIKGVRGYNFASRFSPGSPVVRLARERVEGLAGFSRVERAYWLYERGLDLYRSSQDGLRPDERKKLMGYELARLRSIYYEAEPFRDWLRFLSDPDPEIRKMAYDVISFEIYLFEREKSFALDSFGEWKIDQLAQEISLKFGMALAKESDQTLADAVWADIEENMDGIDVDSKDFLLLSLLSTNPEGPLSGAARDEIEDMSCGALRIAVEAFWNNTVIKESRLDQVYNLAKEQKDKTCQPGQ